MIWDVSHFVNHEMRVEEVSKGEVYPCIIATELEKLKAMPVQVFISVH